ncbi:uncharacterized protein [Clytia hemisphaerica]|uniref:Uncharacterized protein n=1 Tax=Clytia hemisphaerica TaxID=252671 RepID=A0A7M6DNJ7_9CNID
MGGSDEGDASTAKADQTVRGLKTDSEDLVESYKSLKTKVEGNKRSIIGLTTEMVEVRKRIRQLINKRTEAAGPDYDEYKMNRKISKTFEPIDVSRSRSAYSKVTNIDPDSGAVETVTEESSYSVKVTVNSSSTVEESED